MKSIRSITLMFILSILFSFMSFLNVSAAMLKNEIFYPKSDAENKYIYEDKSNGFSNVSGSDIRFCDAGNYIIYKMPLNSAATKASLVLTVSQNYIVWVSTDHSNWKLIEAAPGLAGVGECGNGNKKDLVVDMMPYIKAGAQDIYFKLGDQTTGNGWGGIIWRAVLTYADFTPTDTTPYTAKTEISFMPDTPAERRFIYEDKGSQAKDNIYMRFCDGSGYVVYRIPYDSSKNAYLKVVIDAYYRIWVSSDATKYTQIAEEPTPGDPMANGKSLVNKRMIVYDLKDYKGKKIDYIYLKVGDKTTENGWGGAIHSVALSYDSPKLYNPFDLTGVVYPAPSKPSSSTKASSIKSTTSRTSTSTQVSSTDSTVSTETPSSEVSSDGSSIVSSDSSAISSTTSTTSDKNDTDNSGTNTAAIIIIIAITLVLLGGAVTQFIFMEKRR